MSAFVRSEEGEKIQKRIWNETIALLGNHVPEVQLDELLRNFG